MNWLAESKEACAKENLAKAAELYDNCSDKLHEAYSEFTYIACHV